MYYATEAKRAIWTREAMRAAAAALDDSIYSGLRIEAANDAHMLALAKRQLTAALDHLMHGEC